MPLVAGDELRADVAGHDDDRVLEVDRAALAVGQAPVVEDLQQHVEHVRVRLLDLVEQDHLVRPPADRLGQLAALVVADVAGRRADQAATRSTSPCTRSCRCGSGPTRRRTGTAASARASSVLPTPVGPRKMKEPIGRLGSFSPARARRTASRDGLDGLVLADDPLVQPVLHVDELGLLALQQPGHGDARPGRRRCGRCRPRRPLP